MSSDNDTSVFKRIPITLNQGEVLTLITLIENVIASDKVYIDLDEGGLVPKSEQNLVLGFIAIELKEAIKNSPST